MASQWIRINKFLKGNRQKENNKEKNEDYTNYFRISVQFVMMVIFMCYIFFCTHPIYNFFVCIDRLSVRNANLLNIIPFLIFCIFYFFVFATHIMSSAERFKIVIKITKKIIDIIFNEW
jgi:hypothetical protein